MEIHYSLSNIREIAGGDESFIPIIIAAFLEEVPEAVQLIEEGLQEKNHTQVYQNAHKIKPTVEQFKLAVYEDLLLLQNWGKQKQNDNVEAVFEKFKTEMNNVILEMKTDFDL